MQHKETVTFGGGGLDRAAHLRFDVDQQVLRQRPDALLLFMWRGKPLMDDTSQIVFLPMSDFQDIEDGPIIFLGLAMGIPVFAKDISKWTPDDQADVQDGFADDSVQKHPGLAQYGAFAELRTALAMLPPLDAEIAGTARRMFAWHQSHGFCANCGGKTNVSDAGWRRVCPSCDRSHFPRTDPVVIMLILQGNEVLVGRSASWPAGMYSLLAGFVEPGETIEAAVRREVWEESGIHVGPVEYLASQPWPFPASLMLGCVGIAQTYDLMVDPTELEDAVWISKERMLSVYAGDDPLIKPARKGSIAHFLIENWLGDRLA
ncbi:MAG: NAD(+) diphosphatase [Planktomarina sp.]